MNRCRASVLFGASLLAAVPALAQGARGVQLAISPRQGDTVYMRVEQMLDMTATTRRNNADTSMDMHSTMLILSRNIVQARDEHGATLLIITDSIAMAETGGGTAPVPDELRRTLQGKRIRTKLSPQGTWSILESPDLPATAAQPFFSPMPAILPAGPVNVGDAWTQTMTIPIAGQPEGRSAGTIRATFRLDSLARRGELAYISMRGVVVRDSTDDAQDMPNGYRMTSSGNVSGVMLLDRKRGWLTESRITISVKSVMSRPGDAKATPMRFQIRVTQRMRVEADGW
ncbi:MAG: DUF6263 family protein [Gemmatimonadaceae bacterium]